jgi:hypothetical protein
MQANNMPIAPSATIQHVEAFKKCQRFALDSKVKVISTHNPWRPNAHGFNLFEHVLRNITEATVGEVIEAAMAIGYDRNDAARKLRWLYTWGDFIEIDGVRYFPEIPSVPQQAIPSEPKRKQIRKAKRS